ncbi:hypothetical protein PBI_PAEDORE_82 [Streptomyces phage Paedore]|uniref:Uncharacterized protein n=1 Tax=Streptomyces phage Paedore TaxID=2108134 RepID=A0A2P1JTU4_9CAUD|nr:hypothetical protein KGG91_gp82 [Streptomyces phage Paedore]AVO22565.1 hypothetical protein PBI_PAEDORE_82 [Streptomyces phage Paedore]
MVSLDKTPLSISYGRMRANILAGVRRNNLRALSLEFGERLYLAERKAHEARMKAIFGGRVQV